MGGMVTPIGNQAAGTRTRVVEMGRSPHGFLDLGLNPGSASQQLCGTGWVASQWILLFSYLQNGNDNTSLCVGGGGCNEEEMKYS